MVATSATKAAPSLSQELPATYQQCLTRAGAVDPTMKECGANELARQDKGLNAAYKALITGLSPNLIIDVKRAQRTWLLFRAAQCSFAYDREAPGSLATILLQQCELRLTARRIQELQDMVSAQP
jgi:uncharacterized protein YecT (DUF1311 family)